MAEKHSVPRWIEFRVRIDLGAESSWATVAQATAVLAQARRSAAEAVRTAYLDSHALVIVDPPSLRFDDQTTVRLSQINPCHVKIE